MKLSSQERAILAEIQRDLGRSLGEIADAVGVSQSTLWRKLREFEDVGLIRARVALLDPARAGVGLCVLASITLHDHTEQALDALAGLVRTHPEIMECFALSGDADYMLKIRVADVAAYEAFMSHNLLRNPHIRSVRSSFVLKEIKATTQLPL